MRPDEILRARIDLLGKAQSNGPFPRVIRSILSENVDDSNDGVTDPAVVEALYTAFRSHLQAAYSYRVTESMTDLVIAAAAGLDDTDRFNRDLAPTGCGIVYFDKPLPMVDVRGNLMLIHWLSWGPVSDAGRPAVAQWTFNDIYIQPDEYSRRMLDETPELIVETIGRWGFIGAQVTVDGEALGPPEVPINEHTVERIAADGDPPTPPTNLDRYTHALWLLLNQTIVETEIERVTRHTRKSMARMKMPESITMIRLRRSESTASPGESHVQWQHRWIVRGHWAWRHCGPDHPNAQPYKDGFGTRVWISPYMKGPDDKPLVVTDKLYDLAR